MLYLLKFKPGRFGSLRGGYHKAFRTKESFFKIGFTESLAERLHTISTYPWPKFELVGLCPGPIQKEKLIHSRFAQYRHCYKCEFFHPGAAESLHSDFFPIHNHSFGHIKDIHFAYPFLSFLDAESHALFAQLSARFGLGERETLQLALKTTLDALSGSFPQSPARIAG